MRYDGILDIILQYDILCFGSRQSLSKLIFFPLAFGDCPLPTRVRGWDLWNCGIVQLTLTQSTNQLRPLQSEAFDGSHSICWAGTFSQCDELHVKGNMLRPPLRLKFIRSTGSTSSPFAAGTMGVKAGFTDRNPSAEAERFRLYEWVESVMFLFTLKHLQDSPIHRTKKLKYVEHIRKYPKYFNSTRFSSWVGFKNG